ncbi:RapH N-terminal domain-containing protein [Bacillus cereus]|uniref:Tetratricopeptide repeat family protein n=1 Tax=Bacillus cereus 03BB108 TaxID=451709 RepID=A0AAN0W4Z9_BACCE|nr:RapH N-terminal domain-containing protein [Bacillus cereus]AJI09086.1 tetratricopeptide repeat family protein [Bacillus cereus 03BB108]EDX59577.1 tetratricopeptide domain protein [Bacillus cereus 03BB108]QKG98724.1 RapH N-terminal domain-containing protein [Bacillus cereus]
MVNQLKTSDKITQLLNDWYQEIRAQHIKEANTLKNEIEKHSESINKDSILLFHYSLLAFRFKVLVDHLSITQTSFQEIDSLDLPQNDTLSYYYYFFKGIHATLTSNNNEAWKHYEKAETFLKNIHDDLEIAEFNYRFANFYLHTYQSILAIQHITTAREIFSRHNGYENNVAACENIYGLACVDLRQFPLAEEKFNSAINILRKNNEDSLILRVRNNLGFLYSSQNLSASAIRQLTEVTKKIPTHFKALFLEARERFKLGELNHSAELVEQGLNICEQLDNKEYLYHFKLLDAMNKDVPAAILEELTLEAISFFNEQQLYNYTQEYTEQLAIKFYEEDTHIKASKYFHMSLQAKEKTFEKGALK